MFTESVELITVIIEGITGVVELITETVELITETAEGITVIADENFRLILQLRFKRETTNYANDTNSVVSD